MHIPPKRYYWALCGHEYQGDPYLSYEDKDIRTSDGLFEEKSLIVWYVHGSKYESCPDAKYIDS